VPIFNKTQCGKRLVFPVAELEGKAKMIGVNAFVGQSKKTEKWRLGH